MAFAAADALLALDGPRPSGLGSAKHQNTVGSLGLRQSLEKQS